MMMVQQSLTYAAREGCREGILVTTNSQSQVDTAVRSFLQSVIPNASNVEEVSVEISPTNFVGVPSGTPITVKIEVDFGDVSWLPGSLFGGDLTLVGQSTQERE